MTYKLGVIGTSWITSQFIEAAQAKGQYELTAVYSRRQETGVRLTDEFGHGCVETDFGRFLNRDLDVIYIASPNSLHFEQAKAALLHHHNVICEKPAVTRPSQLIELREILEADPELFFFEAQRNLYDPNLKIIKDLLEQIGTIDGASITYMKRSSRFAEVEVGKLPNVFSNEFSGGALSDLGVYAVYFATALFGKPTESLYDPLMLPVAHGADIFGLGLLKYPHFSVELKIGKSTTSYAPTEIYGEKGTILVSNPADLTEIRLARNPKDVHDVSLPHNGNPLRFEADFFYWTMQRHDRIEMFEQLDKSVEVSEILQEMRESAGDIWK
ncbi:Gfo/Idh/MocA family protein [Xylocopilactobacillus apicola]|uniref:Oxidoreductase n=1 Tax=Xylocopilactobacillus apicola TaxID=2932184 RepID=A0AAU9CZL4_9LACO|nr:Gfo/Idh/MocA family oxidoreductase [Xylocopilactobacillus apicola]BDR59467.1 oxidoreductase [Xylocopilactobacillus apicola]